MGVKICKLVRELKSLKMNSGRIIPVLFRVLIEPQKYDRNYSSVEPRPSNKILVSFKLFVEHFEQAPPLF